ncbi:MAG: F0F1 ATP synthase subunit delta [Pseudomonadota bacterium]|jgi:F-type H+-transporting ATPase subunit delta|uniref:ATP synthase subunit delta n=2 Tax=Methylophaga TaxID=40222 RepID=F5SYV7_9GAMM|nr:MULTISPECIES: F0F1 ATP synthase subunit delta [Methylophaga]MEC9413818.1 F0F1 ATP synthase subunit delta [Pseudomonadota bacterium]EGL54278.1 F0F1-type ATP synthase, delta subunit [Methylophaga aminisulfidivorans MP]WVI85472.1 F0F1 ATP synthase subunit delta [Methylophaga thalassica]GLQ00655.1 ATP synthase subunit delta [Methylophaga thalassica]HIC47454.1 F0F1 ATP synthase subunit delta [Methylophaga sp.]
MAEAITIARPYANAVFSIAQEKGELKAWSDLLAVLAQCVLEPEMQSIITSPAVSDEQAVDLLAEIAGDAMTADARNFLLLLAENNRLLLLTDITVLFEALREEAEKLMTADVISARPLTEEQAAKISAALKARLGRDITLNTTIDESLLGGAIIRAGDMVIDGSAVGKLNRLANAIT